MGFLCFFDVIENINNYWASCGLEIDLVVGFLFGSYLSALKWIIGVWFIVGFGFYWSLELYLPSLSFDTPSTVFWLWKKHGSEHINLDLEIISEPGITRDLGELWCCFFIVAEEDQNLEILTTWSLDLGKVCCIDGSQQLGENGIHRCPNEALTLLTLFIIN